jgi:hypothetical protein
MSKHFWPRAKMVQMDQAATAYYLRNITTIAGENIVQADVMSHGDVWLELRIEGQTGYHRFIQWSYIVGLDLVEG